VLWVRLAGAKSRADLTVALARGRRAVDIQVRALWDERSARLHLTMPGGATSARYEVPGGDCTRGAIGEVPGLRWAAVSNAGAGFGFVSDALSSFSIADGVFRATLLRASRYADDVKTAPTESLSMPAVDCGELSCRLVIAPADERLPLVARELAHQPIAQTVSASAPVGPALARSGTLAELQPTTLALLACKPAEDGKGLVLRVQETAGWETAAQFTLLGTRLSLGKVGAGKIASWRLVPAAGGWTAQACDLLERPLG
jgi:alpha-mannosidase